MNFTYLMQPPKRYTFEQPKLKLWTEEWMKGRVLNLFAGKTLMSPSDNTDNCKNFHGIDLVNSCEIRVDIDKECPADFYMDSYEFVEMALDKGWKFDTIIFDPPYNLRKSREKYGERYIGSLTKIKNILMGIVRDDGYVISFGYDTVGMSASRGFEKVAICLVCHSGDHNDTICLVEKKIEDLYLPF